MERIANAIVEQSLARGGLLLHAALAVRDGYGVLLAGPSGVGKSTASRRLTLPWQSLSDDCVLVVRDKDGRYWAHPWPTWSLLRKRGTVASWPVEPAVPLQALMFLNQSSLDRAEPVATTPATALIVESALHLIETVTLTQDGYASRAICRKYLRAAWALAAAVPAFRLQVSLTGRFWKEIERNVITAKTEPESTTKTPRHEEACGEQTAKDAKTAKFRKELSADYADGHRRGIRIDQNSDTRNQNAEVPKDGAADKGGRATSARTTRSVPEPPRRLLSGKPRPRLVRFQTRDRVFVKLVRGRRVVASVNDLLREWYIRRPSGR
jgi:hypothetical protein